MLYNNLHDVFGEKYFGHSFMLKKMVPTFAVFYLFMIIMVVIGIGNIKLKRVIFGNFG